MLHKFNMNQCKPIQTLMETKLNVSSNEHCIGNFPYQQIIGFLMHLVVLTRPDIAYTVGYLSQFNNCYSKHHCAYDKAASRIFKMYQRL